MGTTPSTVPSDGGRAVVELGVDADGQAHEQQRVQIGGRLREVGKALLGSGRGVLPKKVLAGIGGAGTARAARRPSHRPQARRTASTHALTLKATSATRTSGVIAATLTNPSCIPYLLVDGEALIASPAEGFRSLGQRVTHRARRNATSKKPPRPIRQDGEVRLRPMRAGATPGSRPALLGVVRRGTRECGEREVGKELVGRALLGDDALVHKDDLVGDVAREGHLVGDDDHGHAVGREVAHDVEDLSLELQGRARRSARRRA